MEKLGFDFIHQYGLTESFGPTSLRLLSQLGKKLNTEEKAELLARQGVRHATANRIQVLDESGKDVHWDEITNGEIVYLATLFSQDITVTQKRLKQHFVVVIFILEILL